MSFWEFLDRNPQAAILGGFFIFGIAVFVIAAVGIERCG